MRVSKDVVNKIRVVLLPQELFLKTSVIKAPVVSEKQTTLAATAI